MERQPGRRHLQGGGVESRSPRDSAWRIRDPGIPLAVQAGAGPADRNPAEDGPAYYTTRRFSLGAALLDVVRRALQEDAVTHTKAAKILGVSRPP